MAFLNRWSLMNNTYSTGNTYKINGNTQVTSHMGVPSWDSDVATRSSFTFYLYIDWVLSTSNLVLRLDEIASFLALLLWLPQLTTRTYFMKPITSMTVVELQQNCNFFELPQNGITPMLRNWLQNYLTAHKHEMQHNYDYTALYPDRDPLLSQNRHNNESQSSQVYSQWDGIGAQAPPPWDHLVHTASMAASTNHHVEEYLQGMSPSLLSLAPSLHWAHMS